MMGGSRSHGDPSRRCHARQHDRHDAHPGSGAATEEATVGRYGIQSGVLRVQSPSDENASGEFDDVSSIVLLRYSAGCVFGMLWRASRMSSDRQQVLVAFQEVEDNLANLRILTDQIQAQNDDSVQASGRTAQLSRAQYREGSVSYLDVIDSERTVLQNQRAAMQLTGAQAVYTVNLIRALGGGWDAPTSPTQPASPLAAR